MNDDVAENVVPGPHCAMCELLRGDVKRWSESWVKLMQDGKKIKARRDRWRAKYEEMVRTRNAHRELAQAAVIATAGWDTRRAVELHRERGRAYEEQKRVVGRLRQSHEQAMRNAEQEIARVRRSRDRWKEAAVAAMGTLLLLFLWSLPW